MAGCDGNKILSSSSNTASSAGGATTSIPASSTPASSSPESSNGTTSTPSSSSQEPTPTSSTSEPSTSTPESSTSTSEPPTSSVAPVATFLVRFLDSDGTELQSETLEEGTVPTYKKENPRKTSTDLANFTFSGWDKEIVAVHANTDYNATYLEERFAYEVKYVKEDGSLIVRLVVAKNATVAAAEVPTLPEYYVGSESLGVHRFQHWSEDLTTTAVNADVVVSPVYTYDNSQALIVTHHLDETTTSLFVSANTLFKLDKPLNTRTKRFVSYYTESSFQTAVATGLQMATANLELFPQYLDLDTTTGTLTYTVNTDNTLTITGFDKLGREYLDIPSTIDGKTVTAIGENAFKGNDKLCTVIIPSAVTTIGAGAFMDNPNLGYLDLPAALTTIGKGALAAGAGLIGFTLGSRPNTHFALLNGISLINPVTNTLVAVATNGQFQYGVPPSITAVGDYAFYKANDLIYIPGNFTSVGEGSFYQAGFIHGTIPELANLLSIGALAYFKTDLAAFNLTPTLTYLGEGAINGCPNLMTITAGGANTHYAITNNILFDATTMTILAAPAIIPTPILSLDPPFTAIGAYAFYGAQIQTVQASASIISVGAHAFENATSTSIVFSTNVPTLTVGTAAFKGTSLAQAIVFSSGTGLTIGEEAFMNSGITSFPFSATTTTRFGNRAFVGCTKLMAFTIASGNQHYSVDSTGTKLIWQAQINSLKILVAYCDAALSDTATNYTETDGVYNIIGSYAFSLAGKMTSYTAASDLVSVEGHAFAFSNIKTIVTSGFPDNFEPYAFADMASLASFTTAGTMEIGDYCFENDVALTKINFTSTAEDWRAYVMLDTNWASNSKLSAVVCTNQVLLL